MWTFIAHIQWFDETINDDKIDIVAFNTPGFKEAMDILINHYGKTLNAIRYLEPISDLPIIYINSDIEHSIRSIEENSWN